MASGEGSDSERAASAFANYVAATEAGEATDFDAFCADHRELESELRALHTHWRAVRRVFDRLGGKDSLSQWLAALHGTEGDPRASFKVEPRQDLSSEVIARLKEHQTGFQRYRMKGEIDRGGMGAILRVWDEDLRRHLAMKVILGKGTPDPSGETPDVDSRMLGRFLEEAQVTGQLDHPNIVPVHELGLDPEGRVYFTMKLVKGRDLKAVFQRVASGEGGWSLTRALGVILKVCEAMRYAHAKHVVHRDLKPANVMVGRFGEVYVMDWGLARVENQEDTKDIRVLPEALLTSDVHSMRRERKELDGDSPLYTMDGDVVGTPAYMSPEQARGQIELVGPTSDVYAVGAMLYQLLTSRVPFVTPGSKVNNYAIWQRVQEGPPKPVQELAPDAPPELVAVCQRAMEREMDQRYPSMEALADDLRAWLEGRVVRAYESGAAAEFRKWVGRNRLVAGALAALIFVLTTSGFVVAWQKNARVVEARENQSRVQRLLDEKLARALMSEVDELGPIHPGSLPALRTWLEDAESLAGRLPAYRAELDVLESNLLDRGLATVRTAPEEHPSHPRRVYCELKVADITPFLADFENAAPDDAQAARRGAILEGEVAALEREARRLEAAAADFTVWSVDDPELAAAHSRLLELVRNGDALVRPEDGALATVRERERLAAGLSEATVTASEPEWETAIADVRASPHYGGLELRPQVGLIPLGSDPDSGLFEFWHVLSGARPERGSAGRFTITPETGLVLVLVPGGTFRMGRDADVLLPDGELFPARGTEQPEHDVTLEPYFLSKYELTQAQWVRATGNNPSQKFPGQVVGKNGAKTMISPTHPVESVSWTDADRVLRCWSLLLPTDAQWEHAARAGAEGVVWTESLATLLPEVNFADDTYYAVLQDPTRPGIDDGYAAHAPVDAFAPNPFGLHNVAGNVWEWCRDWYDDSYDGVGHRAGDGAITIDGTVAPRSYLSQSQRGGGFTSEPRDLRSTYRRERLPRSFDVGLGVRPSREID